jgi:electron transport complex protein RnfA
VGELFLILISTGLANNFVLTHMLGVDPLIATSRKSGPAMDTCLFMVTTMPVVAAVLYLFNVYLFTPFIPDHLHLMATVMLIAITVMVNGFILQKLHAKLFSRIEKIIPLMLANSALLGLVLIENNYVYSFSAALFFGLGSALGFSLVLMMMVSIRNKLDNPDIPVPFQGIAILFITLGLLSMGFMGFSGLNLIK